MSTDATVFRQIQAAQQQYFQDVNNVWTDTQSNFAAMQDDLQRDMERAVTNQDNDALQNALSEFQATVQDNLEDDAPGEAYEEAFRTYKGAMQKVFGGDLDDMTFGELAQFSQSLVTVGSVACSISQAMASSRAMNDMARQMSHQGGFGMSEATSDETQDDD